MSEDSTNTLDLGSIDFTPDWARKDPKTTIAKSVKPIREGDGERRPTERKPFEKKPFAKKPFDRKPFERKPRFEERPKPLDAEVKVLPETKALGTIIRKLQQDFHAYKLKDLAYFFLDNLQSVLLKITPRAAEGAEPQRFYQCKACGFASTEESDVIEHALSAHFGDYYDAKEIEVEPPKGNFNCVAKCGLSGVLLGPPNIHEFNSVVKEMVRTRYPEMTEEQYRAHIEMVRDSEVIEEWRKGATKQTVFFAKGTAEVEGAAQMSREQAEGEFKRTILANLVDRPKHLMITAEVALKSPVKPLVWAVRDALSAEQRAPYEMCFALRGAFHRRKLNFFRANDAHGPEFVSGIEYREFDVEHAIPELSRAAKFVAENPCCDKSELGGDAEMEKHLDWLATTGHVVAFTNGVFSAVEKFPKYGPQWKKRAAKKPVEEKTEEKAAEKAEMPVEAPAVAPVEEKKPEIAEEKKEEKKDETAAELA